MKVFSAVLLVILMAGFASAQNTAIYKVQGGNEMVVGSGGSLTIASGGSLTLDSGSTFTVGSAISATDAATVAGQFLQGAAATRSTMTAAGVATFHASVGVPATGMVYLGQRTIAQLMAATAVLGQIGICSNCSPVEVFIATAAGLGAFGNAAGAQLD
jgi:hypothetical protein